MRIILKLLAKASVPLLLLVGSVSYSSYMLGHDPFSYFRGLAEHGRNQISGLFSTVRQGTSNAYEAARALAPDTEQKPVENKNVVYTWKDSDGVTHYGSSAPENTAASTLHIDPNVNVIRSVELESRSATQKSLRPANPSPVIATHEKAPLSEKLSGLTKNFGSSSTADNDSATREVAEQLGGELPGIAGKLLPGGNDSDGTTDLSKLLERLQQ